MIASLLFTFSPAPPVFHDFSACSFDSPAHFSNDLDKAIAEFDRRRAWLLFTRGNGWESRENLRQSRGHPQPMRLCVKIPGSRIIRRRPRPFHIFKLKLLRKTL